MMKRNTMRCLSLLLCLLMVVGLMPAAFADTAPTELLEETTKGSGDEVTLRAVLTGYGINGEVRVKGDIACFEDGYTVTMPNGANQVDGGRFLEQTQQDEKSWVVEITGIIKSGSQLSGLGEVVDANHKKFTVAEVEYQTAAADGAMSAFQTKTLSIIIPLIQLDDNVAMRIYGRSRYETSLAVAEFMLETQGKRNFDAVIVTTGANFPDALCGSFLGVKKDAPILLVDKAHLETVRSYIQNHLNPGGTVYLLGGAAVVPDNIRSGLESFTVKRLWGANRYETNLEILKEVGVQAGENILVCSGLDFADSLSASAAGMPIMLVSSKLTDNQKAYLDTLTGSHQFVMIGGVGAVSASMKAEFDAYGPTDRVGGMNRYETSILVASRFVPTATQVLLSVGDNYPDGLCGGPLAAKMGASVVLTADSRIDTTKSYLDDKGISKGAVLGGPTLISDNTVKTLFSVTSVDEFTYPPELHAIT